MADLSAFRGGLIDECFTKNVAGGVDVTLAVRGEADRSCLIFTGALTASIAVIFPATAESAGLVWQIENQTTGAFLLSVKNSGGTALVIPAGVRSFVLWTGTAFVFASSQIQMSEIILTSAQVKALRATPITIFGAPGAGKLLEFLSAQLILDYGGTNGFTEAGNNLAVRFVDGTGVIVSQAIEMTGFIDQTADTATTAQPKIDVIAAKAACENVPLVLHNTSGAEIAGNAANDNIVRVKTCCRVHATGW